LQERCALATQRLSHEPRVLRCRSMQTKRPEVVERFRTDRDQEYVEFGVRCRDFLAEIAKETAARNLTFAALEENEHDLQKLQPFPLIALQPPALR